MVVPCASISAAQEAEHDVCAGGSRIAGPRARRSASEDIVTLHEVRSARSTNEAQTAVLLIECKERRREDVRIWRAGQRQYVA